jgi:hypothetical protein
VRSHAQRVAETRPGEGIANGRETEGSDLRRQPSDGSPVLNALPAKGSGLAAHARTLSSLNAGAPSEVAPFLLGLQQRHGNRYVQQVVREAKQEAGKATPQGKAALQDGRPSDEGVRRSMQGALHGDFSRMRVHPGRQAAASLNRVPQEAGLAAGQPSGLSSAPVVQRQCVCGGVVTSGEECDRCREAHKSAPALKPKLVIGSVNDPIEQEADRVADEVIRMDNPVGAPSDDEGVLRRQRTGCAEKEPQLARKEGRGAAVRGVP